MIHERIFGSPIDDKVKEELEKRQHQKRNSDNVLQSLGDTTPEYNLSERTPFVRMWTSMKFITPEVIEETLETFEVFEDEGSAVALSRATEYSRANGISQIKDIKDSDGKIIKYAVYDPYARDRVDYATQTYIVGDYNYQKAYGSSKASQTNFKLLDPSQSAEAKVAKAAFPRLLKDNPLLKPQAGITSAVSETQEFLGAIKKTTVNFVVHNFFDFDRIYNRYFLKPGATIFVDFGWSDIVSLYTPEKMLESDDIMSFLYDDNTGQISQNPDKLEVIQGIVVDYSSKILPNGSVECSVTLQSTNSALLNQSTDVSTTRRIQDILMNGTRYLGIIPTLKSDPATTEELKRFLLTPNKVGDFGSVETFEENLRTKSKIILSSDDMQPEGNPVRTGVYVSSLTADDVYISLGFFEDIIMNEQFGFGKDVAEINKGKNLEVRMDSSNSFISFSDSLFLKQKSLISTSDTPAFLYPKSWGDTDIDGLGSYSHQMGKYPKKFYSTEPGAKSHTEQDKAKKRIPIRELFINAETIISAFELEKDIKSIIGEILRQINEDSDTLFNLSIMGGGVGIGNELKIIDNNKVASIDNQNPQFFTNMFTFNVMSPNSIIRDYNLEFKLPSDDIGNMYAIQGMGNENKIYPASDLLDDVVAMNSLDKDSLSILYRPDLGSYRAEQLSSEDSKDGELYDVYQNIHSLLSTNIYNVSAKRTFEKISRPLPFRSQDEYEQFKNPPPAPKTTIQSSLINKHNRELVAAGFRVVISQKEFYKKEVIKESVVSIVDRPNLLPFTITLTIYGISSIQPGDTFRVNYLPELYQKNTFLQTMNVAHNINSDGWFTTLDAQFRPLPDVKKSHYNEVKNAKPYYSPFYLQEIYQIIKDKFYNINWKYGNPTNNKKVDLKKVNGRESFTLAQITEYMTKIEPYNFDFPSKRSSIKSIYSFEVTDEITKELGDKNWIGSFNYECPQEYEMIEGSNMVGGEIVYSRKDVKYLDINGAINDLQYYQPYPVQFLPGEKLYFVYNEDGAGFFTDESGVKYENLKKFDTPIGQAMTFPKKRPLTEYEKEKRVEAKIDYNKPGRHKPRI